MSSALRKMAGALGASRAQLAARSAAFCTNATDSAAASGPRICLLSFEPLGDLIGSHLVDAIAKKSPNATVFGLGGDRMKQRGFDSFMDFPEITSLGLTTVSDLDPFHRSIFYGSSMIAEEDIKNAENSDLDQHDLVLPTIQTYKKVLQSKPDVVVSINSMALTTMISHELKRAESTAPLLSYSLFTDPNSIFRSQELVRSQSVNHFLALYPEDMASVPQVDLPCTFVGSPLVDALLDHSGSEEFRVQADGAGLRKQLGISNSDTVITLCVGSRLEMILNNAKVFAEAASKLQQKLNKKLHVLLPNLPKHEQKVTKIFSDSVGSNSQISFHFVDSLQQQWQAYAASDAAMSVPSYVMNELALAGVPQVVGLDTKSSKRDRAQKRYSVKNFAMLNRMQDQQIIPEFMFDQCTSDNLANGLHQLLSDSSAAQQQQQHAQRALRKLICHQSNSISEQQRASSVAADAILKFVGQQRA